MFNKRHILTNLAGSALPLLVIILSVPLYLKVVGAEKYGTLSLVWIVFGYFGVLDFGISRAVTNAISKARADGREKRRIVWSACAIAFVTGVLIALVAGGGLFAWFTAFPMSPIIEIRGAVVQMMLGVPVLMVTSTLNGALDGEERFKMSNAIQVVGAVAYQLVPLGCAIFISDDIVSLITAVIVCRYFVFILIAAATARAFRLFDEVRVTKGNVASLLRFGWSVALINLIDPIFSRVDQLVIAKFSGSAAVAAYNIAVNAVVRLSILPIAVSRSIFPHLSSMLMSEAKPQLIAAVRKVSPVWFIICVASMFASDIAFRIWLQNEISASVAATARVFLVGLWANCLSILPYTALQAFGQSSKIIRAHIAEMPFYVVALVVLTYHYGPLGAAAAYGARNLADNLILWRMCGLKLGEQKLFVAQFAALSLIAYLSVS